MLVVKAICSHERLRTVLKKPFSTLPSKPVLSKISESGSEEAIDEAELFRYTRYRWLSGEDQKLARRFRSFNLQGLLGAAVASTGGGAKSCVRLLKCVEGQYNKAFVLTMDNGVEVIAKIPNPNAGPSFFTTAAEVATRHVLRQYLGLPVPRILSWSAQSSNPVGSEYIVEEKAAGRPLGSLWYQWSGQRQRHVASQVVDLERKLESLSFSNHGSIYYTADLEAKGIPAQSISTAMLSGRGLDPSILKQFSLGPLTRSSLWEKEKADMVLDRGPWSNAVEYAEAMIQNEIKWVEAFAKPRINWFRSTGCPEPPDDYLSLLKRSLLLAPYLVPPPSEDQRVRTLSHPDLHLDNVFVDEATGQITSVIDWQSSCVSELFFQRGLPPMLPQSDSSISDTDGARGEAESRENEEQSGITDFYIDLVRQRNPARWIALKDGDRARRVRRKPLDLVTGAWARDDVFSFRHALINVVAHWDEAAGPGAGPCPLEFSRDEYAEHEAEMELMDALRGYLQRFRDSAGGGVISPGGMVPRADYERCQALNQRFRQDFISLGADELERTVLANIWPYQEDHERGGVWRGDDISGRVREFHE